MAEQYVRVYLAPGDEAQLADLEPDDFIEFAGSINGSPVPVRFYRPDEDADDDTPQRTTEPLAIEQLRSLMDDDGFVTAIVALDLEEVIDNSLDGVNEYMSAAVTGDDYGLMDISWEVVGHEGRVSILVAVTGNVSEYLKRQGND